MNPAVPVIRMRMCVPDLAGQALAGGGYVRVNARMEWGLWPELLVRVRVPVPHVETRQKSETLCGQYVLAVSHDS
jgi:hypothetical protein